VGKRGREGRLGEADATQWLPGVAEKVGGGADIFVDGPEQEDEQDHERLTETSEAFIYLAMSRLMARRLARS
jgi:hypothetical protein